MGGGISRSGVNFRFPSVSVMRLSCVFCNSCQSVWRSGAFLCELWSTASFLRARGRPYA